MTFTRAFIRNAPFALLASATLSAGAADIVSNAGNATPARAQAMTQFKQLNAHAHFATHRDGRIGRVYGRAFSFGDSSAESVHAFLSEHADMWGVTQADLIPEGPFEDKRHTQPVMYLPESDSYKFTATFYSQVREGIPVYGSKLVLLTRNEPGNPLVLASSQLFDLSDFNPNPVAARAAANPEILLQTARDTIMRQVQIVQTERMIFVGDESNPHEPVIADITLVDVDGYDKHEMITDAATGKVIRTGSIISKIDAMGNISAMASQGPASDVCEDEVLRPLPYLNVNLQGGGSAITDVSGNYTIPHTGTGEVTIDASLDGQWFNVYSSISPDLAESVTASPAAMLDLLFNSANTSEFDRAQVNAYIESNTIRDWVLATNPAFPQVADIEMDIFVNRNDALCPGNAWYDPFQLSMHFCSASFNNPNTAWSSVIYHEFGHHLVSSGGFELNQQGQYGEGTADVMSVIILDDPNIGLGFNGNCGSPLRSANTNLSYPCFISAHACASLYSGAIWGVRNLLVVTEPDDYQSLLMSWAVNSIFLHTAIEITPQMTIDYLTLDDDDADIGNGTPHYFEIDGGFAPRNMPAPTLNPLNIEPINLPDFADPDGSTVLSAEFTNLSGTLDTSTPTLMVDTGSGFQAIPMSNAAGNTFEAAIPSTDCGESIQFYFTAQTTTSETFTHPLSAPSLAYQVIAASQTSKLAFNDDFESDQGWSITGDPTSSSQGRWERATPIGEGQRGDNPTDFDFSGKCYVTGNGTPGTDHDIDGGTTILTSPPMDASSARTLSYARWYDNSHPGGTPNQDTFVVEVSDNNGAAWTTLETVGPSGPDSEGGWNSVQFDLDAIPGFIPNNQFRIRFLASDLGPGSIVEAAIDAVQLSNIVCSPPCIADLNSDGNLDFFDVSVFLNAYNAMNALADLNNDGIFNFFDVSTFLNTFNAGCP